MEKTPNAYFQHDDNHPGYALRQDQDFVINNCEFLSLHIAMSMYEGAESAGSYTRTTELDGPAFLRAKQKGEPTEFIGFGWSWALLPENAEESEHLRQFCPRTLFRDMQ